ncbi:tyrosine-type recombinase/integrase [Herbidospora sp. NEAU-GS84]|uniref:Tyrosine-type recombinase/integrase n=1 Tax=Herbidospora solisilvae TaxID=2696284 RepID=A0A7C9IZW1_9ACTN|nr:tyrosine-type recombinase/integrase [Herbidospora solisilvae]NAS20262.1 tyrosine-type recombinase/integrase [Herbidospora solisilvae]
MTPGKSRPAPLPLSAAHTPVLAAYAAALETAPLAASTRAKYVARLRGYLAWLAGQSFDGDPLTDPATATGAVRGFRRHLKNAQRASTTIDTYLSALDDFYARRGVGKPRAGRERDAGRPAPRTLDARRVRRYLAQVRLTATPRDRAIALLPYLAGLRISEVVGIDVADVRPDGLSVRGARPRLVPIHPDLRPALTGWLEARSAWKGVDTESALFVNHRGFRLSDRAARDIVTGFTDPADPSSPLVLRHTFATQLIRDGEDPALVAELLGLESLDSTRRYGLGPTAGRKAVLNSLITDA